MSGQCTGWVLRHGPSPNHLDRKGDPYGLAKARAMRAVLMPIADAANRDGEHSHPGQAAIIEASLYGKSQVSRVLTDLVAEGWLAVEHAGGGRGVATVYRVVMKPHREPHYSDATTPPGGGNGEGNHPIGADKPPHGPRETTPSGQAALLSATDLPNGNPQRSRGDYDPLVGFEAFWSAYPRKTAKGAARKAWPAAVRVSAGNPAPIILGAQRYRDDPNRDPKFTAHASTWLNGERWGDDPLPPRAGVRQPRPPGPSRLGPAANAAMAARPDTYDPEVDF